MAEGSRSLKTAGVNAGERGERLGADGEELQSELEGTVMETGNRSWGGNPSLRKL